jgi:NADH pyrophosphatase NudC (nudix superfamily)
MVNKIDKSLEYGGVFKYYTDSNCSYILDIHETSNGSGVWFIDLYKEYGTPDKKEVFSILKTLADLCTDYARNYNIKKIIAIIDGNDEEEKRKKTIAFTRYIKDEWEYEISNNPEFKLSGKKVYSKIDKNLILITKKEHNHFENCSNCGVKNENYKFCPNCGFKLKED